jgi:hypothetical protein
MMGGKRNRIQPHKRNSPSFLTSRWRAAWRVLLIGSLGLAPTAAESQQAARVDRSQPLEGRWSVELVLDTASVRNPPATRRVTGELAFGTGSWWGDSDRFGRHSIDLGPFFGRMFALPANVTPFGPADTALVTEVSGGVIGDSVGIDFIPRIDHGGISLWGRFYGDSARGRWHRRGTDGSGRFVLRRISKEAVNVAAIPVPAFASATVATATPEPQPKTESKKGAKGAAKTAAKTPAKSASAAVATAGATAPPTTQSTTPSTTLPATAPTTAATAVTTGASTNAPTPASKKPSAPTVTAAATAQTKSSTTAAANPQTGAPTTAPAAAPPARAPSRVVARGIPRQPPIDTSVMGSFRVRMFDKASNKYFMTQYQIRLPDGSWMWGNLRSGEGADGWGPVVYRMPGRYEIVVENFVCGDKFWFFAKKVLQPVVVRLGQTSDVTIELDLSAEPAKPTLDNKTGALCSAGPGTPP